MSEAIDKKGNRQKNKQKPSQSTNQKNKTDKMKDSHDLQGKNCKFLISVKNLSFLFYIFMKFTVKSYGVISHKTKRDLIDELRE